MLQKKKTLLAWFIFFLAICFVGGFFPAKRTSSVTQHYIQQNEPDVFEKLAKRKAGIYFFYFPECPWCKEILPVLKKEALAKKVSVNLINIHATSYSDADKQQLKKIIKTTGNGDEIIVPFIVTIDPQQNIRGQIGLISPTIKHKRANLIKEKVDQLLRVTH